MDVFSLNDCLNGDFFDVLEESSSLPLQDLITIDDDLFAENDGISTDTPTVDTPEVQNVFPAKLYQMLQDAKQQSFEHIISWGKDGTSFHVHSHTMFVERIMPMYFEQTKYESFRRQLNLYGFIRLKKGVNNTVYSHDLFIENKRSLCERINRRRPNRAS